MCLWCEASANLSLSIRRHLSKKKQKKNTSLKNVPCFFSILLCPSLIGQAKEVEETDMETAKVGKTKEKLSKRDTAYIYRVRRLRCFATRGLTCFCSFI